MYSKCSLPVGPPEPSNNDALAIPARSLDDFDDFDEGGEDEGGEDEGEAVAGPRIMASVKLTQTGCE